MRQLIYISSAEHKMNHNQLLEILRVSKENNTKKNISGVLLYDNGTFIQVLEGEEGQLNETFADIQIDERHSNIVIMQNKEIQAREFGDWSMGFENISEIDRNDIDGLAEFNSLLKNSNFIDSSLAKKILLQFKRF